MIILTARKRKVIRRRITNKREIARYNKINYKTVHSQEQSVINRMKLVDRDADKLYYFEVDKGHRNGAEIHCIMQDATVFVFNKKSEKFITVLLARTGQIDHYIDDNLYNSEKKDVLDVLYWNADLNQVTGAKEIGSNNPFSEAQLEEYLIEKEFLKTFLNKPKQQQEVSKESKESKLKEPEFGLEMSL